MQIGMGPLIGSISGGVGGVLGSIGLIEGVVYANKYVFLPAAEHSVAALYGAMGEDRLRTWQEIEYARNTYFNPFFNKVTNLNNTLKEYVEMYVGRDLDGDGFIGKSESVKTNDRSKQLLEQIDKGNQQDGYAKRDLYRVGPTGAKATKVSDGMGAKPDLKYTIKDASGPLEETLKEKVQNRKLGEIVKKYNERTRQDNEGSKNQKLYNALVGRENGGGGNQIDTTNALM